MSNKSLIALLFLIMSAQAFSMAPHERSTVQDEVFDFNQTTKVDAVMLDQIDTEISLTEQFFETEKANLGEPNSHTEGKIRASIIDKIMSGLIDVRETRVELGDIQGLTDADLEPIQNKLKVLNTSIDYLKI